MAAFEELIKRSTDEDLKMFSRTIQEELDERNLKDFLEEKEKVLTALKNFKEKFPYSSIEFATICSDCFEHDTINILEFVDDLYFIR